ncbi:MAG: BLUF domain-containing protein [Burkholderiaceae bacterium]
MQPGLLRLVYTSRASTACDQKALAAILVTARTHNHAADITGQLLFEQSVFAQWLEGPSSAVEGLWSKLQRDPRHHGIQLVSVYKIEQRSFPEWSMAITSAQPELVSHVQGFVHQHVAQLPTILSFPDRILGLFDLLADVQSLNRPRPSARN